MMPGQTKITESDTPWDSASYRSDYSFVPKGADISSLGFAQQTWLLPNINFQMLLCFLKSLFESKLGKCIPPLKPGKLHFWSLSLWKKAM